MGKLTILMAIFNSYVAIYQRVVIMTDWWFKGKIKESQVLMPKNPNLVGGDWNMIMNNDNSDGLGMNIHDYNYYIHDYE